ncbi:GNAT family N-acetyltransferase [Oricola cellulosilytica]|uniref:N-acetyltransferase n=1 Tax=Oricola cellulosilytica TaxID=1429082 RepID=A0A4R0PD28_9HYPH|nr:GNAT family N-acetyltransferase [Oricola cellulosilytica]TCD15196.1 N-acetyltransferase [Oricola cellulosilytica]
MIRLETDRLVLRPWTDTDGDLFFEINSDPEVMEFFVFRRTRPEADELLAKWVADADATLGFHAMELRTSGECLGFCGLQLAHVEPHLPTKAVEIGWRLAKRHWGKGYVTEAAVKWTGYGLADLGLPEIVSYAAQDNRRSTAVMEQLGMRRDASGDFDHPRVPDTHPHLKRHVLYRITAEEWRKQQKAGNPVPSRFRDR